MHLAICDDHIADRKQMERLLGRESDRRISTTGVLYVDSFGSRESILTAPMIYDALFMDMTEDGCNAVELANMLRAGGVSIPIVFCCGKADYRNFPNLPEQSLFLDKPIQVADLSSVIDQLLLFKDSQVKKLEFRNRFETFYMKEEDLLYAIPENRNMRLTLLNGEEHVAEMTSETFCGNLKDCDSYIELISRTVLNMRYVKGINFFKVTMLNGKQFRLSFMESRPLSKAVEEYRRKDQNAGVENA